MTEHEAKSWADRAEAPLDHAITEMARHWTNPHVELGPPGAGWLSASQIFDNGDLIDRLLARQARVTTDLDLKAQAAYLTTGYAMLVSITVAAPFVGSGLVPDLDPSSYLLRFIDDPAGSGAGKARAQSVGVRLASPRFATERAEWGEHPDACLHADRAGLCDHARIGLETHFRPLVDRLRKKSGLSSGALWRLVGDSVAGVFLEAGRRFGRPHDATDAALTILKHPGSPLTNREMHYFDISLTEDGDPGRVLATRTFRARGGCCRFYTSSVGTLCSTCVLRDAQSRTEMLRNGMRRRGDLADADMPASLRTPAS